MNNIDIDGKQILVSISRANKFNAWMYSKVKPYLGEDNLEVGSGIGNISSFVVNDGYKLIFSDLRDQYLEVLKAKYPKNPTLELDLVDSDFRTRYVNLQGKFDCIFAMNVIEHIENDRLALENINWLLKPGGSMFILVPAYMALYNGFDKILEHYRRYTLNSLISVLPESNILEKKFYFNSIGILGWYIFGTILKRRTISEGNMSIYNLILPIVKVMDFLVQGKIGLSAIVVSRKVE
jgi:SAM-dependent methyltransferase